MSLFQEVIMTNLLCLGYASVILTILPTKSPIWKAPNLKIQKLVLFMFSADLLNPAFRETTFVHE